MIENERRLIASLKAGSDKAFQILFHAYHKKVYNTSRRMGLINEDAEGIVQDVFLNIWNNRRRLDEKLSFEALLITIGKRMVFKKIRKKASDIAHQDYIIHTNKNLNNITEDEIIDADLREFLQIGIDRLAPIRRKVFILSKQQGLSNDEITQKLNLSKRTVENHLYRAVKEIKSHLKKENIGIGLVLILILLSL